MGKRGNSREIILDAAEALVSTVGANHMSLDAVAAQAGISKGGLLYLFPSKVALLKGMIDRYVERLESPMGSGRSKRPMTEARRLLAARLAARGQKSATKQRTSSFSMIAAIAERPALLDPVRGAHKRLWQRLQDTSQDPELALLAWFALEGLLYVELFATNPLSQKERKKFLKRLSVIADESGR
jgi:AcrR family transcriptional regulator